MRKLIAVGLLLFLYSCNPDVFTVKEGVWRATLEVQDNQELPFLISAFAKAKKNPQPQSLEIGKLSLVTILPIGILQRVFLSKKDRK